MIYSWAKSAQELPIIYIDMAIADGIVGRICTRSPPVNASTLSPRWLFWPISKKNANATISATAMTSAA